MKNLIIFCLAFTFSLASLCGQQMTWVPSKYVNDNTCLDQSDCGENMVCYKLQYIPSNDGALTSYTTGFLVECNDNISNIKLNSACNMNDKSEQVMACDSESTIVLHCSGNGGDLALAKGEPVYLHQICFQFDKQKDNVMIKESDIVELTTSIDLEDGKSATEYAEYKDYKIINNHVFCHQSSDYLTLSAELLEEGKVKLDWEPAKEVMGGLYSVWQLTNNGQYNLIATYDSKMLKQQSTFDMYHHELMLEEHGDHIFKITYDNNGGDELSSNVAEVYYKDVRFTLNFAPNPTIDRIDVLVTSPEDVVNVIISDISGKFVKNQQISTGEIQTVELISLVPGMYNVSVRSGSDILSEKLIVIR